MCRRRPIGWVGQFGRDLVTDVDQIRLRPALSRLEQLEHAVEQVSGAEPERLRELAHRAQPPGPGRGSRHDVEAVRLHLCEHRRRLAVEVELGSRVRRPRAATGGRHPVPARDGLRGSSDSQPRPEGRHLSHRRPRPGSSTNAATIRSPAPQDAEPTTSSIPICERRMAGTAPTRSTSRNPAPRRTSIPLRSCSPTGATTCSSSTAWVQARTAPIPTTTIARTSRRGTTRSPRPVGLCNSCSRGSRSVGHRCVAAILRRVANRQGRRVLLQDSCALDKSIALRFDDAPRWVDLGGPKGWNNFDSLDVGNGGMDGITDDERRSYMTLWAISATPLYTGDDLTRLDPLGRQLLTNRDVLAINAAGPRGIARQSRRYHSGLARPERRRHVDGRVVQPRSADGRGDSALERHRIRRSRGRCTTSGQTPPSASGPTASPRTLPSHGTRLLRVDPR